MNEPNFMMLSPEGLVKKLNNFIVEREGNITRGNYHSETFIENPFSYHLCGKKLLNRGNYPLIQSINGIGTIITGDMKERDLGSIFVETGEVDPETHEPGTFEFLRLILKDSLELKNGRIVPAGRIEIYREMSEAYGEVTESRRDKRKHWWGSSVVDLSQVVPTSWFYRG